MSFSTYCYSEGFFRRRIKKQSKKLAKKKIIKQKKTRIRRKRFQPRNRKQNNNLIIYGINAAGIKSKLLTFEAVLNKIQPSIWMTQETKLKANETIPCDSLSEFCVYYQNRQNSQGGGVALGVRKDIPSTLISEGGEETEAIAVKVFFKQFSIRVVAAYGPQENAVKEKKENFWEYLEKEANEAELEGEGFIIQMDGNLHAGKELIRGDPNIQNKNGRLFSEFLDRNKNLTVVNNLDVCEGLITRERVLENKTEKAVLDFIIINEKMRPFIRKMIIDEKKTVQFN